MPDVTLTRVRLVAFVSTFALLAACGGGGDSTAPAVPEVLEKTAGDGLSAAVGTSTSASPTVKVSDDGGRPVRGVVVNFAASGGSVTATVDTTDASGVASAGTWTLGTTPGQKTVTASSPSMQGITATFTATATAGAPAKLAFVTQPPATGVLSGEPFAGPTVEIQDSFGNRTGSTLVVTLNLAGDAGPGVLTGTTSVAAVDGRAAFGALTSQSTGQLSLVASAPGVTSTLSTPMTIASGNVGALVKVSGDVQLGAAGTSAFLAPTVRVTDRAGNPVAGETVTFSVVQGGGTIAGPQATSDANGIARLTRWDLGPAAGTHVVRASAGPATADFTATALAPSPFHIELRYLSTPTFRQQQAFEAAWQKWRNAITGDLPDGSFGATGFDLSDCGVPVTVTGNVDDVIIYVQLRPIDGPGRILGSAGPCLTRGPGGLPAAGGMNFDTADLAMMDAEGTLDKAIVHEMGHVLGIGTLWGSRLVGGGSDTSSFSGAQARAAWELLGGAAGSRVPVENCVGYTPDQCGGGTRDSHWRERTFGAELMTGFLNGGVPTPLSRMTLASLQDLGYVVNLAQADAYTLPAALVAGTSVRANVVSSGPRRVLVEEKLPAPRAIDLLPVER